MRRVFGSSIIAAILLAFLVQSALAFGVGGDARNTKFITPAGCSVLFTFDVIAGGASVALLTKAVVQNAGGSLFRQGLPQQSGQPISDVALQNCGYLDVVVHLQDGANSDFSTDGYIGVVFYGRETAKSERLRFEWAFSGPKQTKLLNLKQPMKLQDDPPTPGRNGGATEARTGKGGPFANFVGDMGMAWKSGMLVLGLVGAVSSLYGGQYLLMLVVGFVQHRRACDIPAILETKRDQFPGRLIAIGLNGCRFQPANKSTEELLINVLDSDEFSDFVIKIGDTRYPAFVDGFHGFFSPVFFFAKLNRAELKRHLKESKIAPDFVPHIGHDTASHKWHDQMMARRLLLKSGQEARPYSKPSPF